MSITFTSSDPPGLPPYGDRLSSIHHHRPRLRLRRSHCYLWLLRKVEWKVKQCVDTLQRLMVLGLDEKGVVRQWTGGLRRVIVHREIGEALVFPVRSDHVVDP